LHRNGSHYDAIQMDDLKDQAYQAWLEPVFQAWLAHLADDAAWYLWHPMLTQGYFAAAAAAGLLISRQIIWCKPQFIFGRGEYHWQHELCFYGWRQGHRPPWYGSRNQTTVWSFGYDGNRNDRDHPTQKPAECFAIPMRNHTQQGQVCAEPFSGSGTQFLAAEQTGRLCYGMELEPKYVAVALQRLSDMSLHPERADA
jgi:DNA modification methylase